MGVSSESFCSPVCSDSRVAMNSDASARTIELALMDLVLFWQWMTMSVNLRLNSEKFGGSPVDLVVCWNEDVLT